MHMHIHYSLQSLLCHCCNYLMDVNGYSCSVCSVSSLLVLNTPQNPLQNRSTARQVVNNSTRCALFCMGILQDIKRTCSIMRKIIPCIWYCRLWLADQLLSRYSVLSQNGSVSYLWLMPPRWRWLYKLLKNVIDIDYQASQIFRWPVVIIFDTIAKWTLMGRHICVTCGWHGQYIIFSRAEENRVASHNINLSYKQVHRNHTNML